MLSHRRTFPVEDDLHVLLRAEGHDVLGQTVAVISEVAWEAERRVVFPLELHGLHRVLVCGKESWLVSQLSRSWQREFAGVLETLVTLFEIVWLRHW